MDSKITFFIDPQEWHQLLNELLFLLQKVYGENLDKSMGQLKMQVPNIIALVLSMSQFQDVPTNVSILRGDL